MKPGIISLTTDFSDKDQYVGLMKAVILQINPYVQIIDLCHNIPPHDIKKAAYILKASYRYFPEGTVHIAVVDPGVGTRRRIILLKVHRQYFLAPDNGLLSLVVKEEEPELIINVTNKKYYLNRVSHTFHGRDIFGPVGAYLSGGLDPRCLGKETSVIKTVNFHRLFMDKDIIVGEIICFDNFGNLVTNIDEKMLIRLCKKLKDAKIEVKGKTIYGIEKTYTSVKPGGLLAIVGSTGYLEISANKASARDILNANIGDKVRVIKKNS